MWIIRKSNFVGLLLLLVLSCLILNPYTVFGNLALFLVVPCLIYSFFIRFQYFNKETFAVVVLMIFISMIGVFVSFVNGIGQFVHLKVSISLFVYLLVAQAVYIFFSKKGFRFNDFVYFSFLGVVINSLVIVAEVFIPSVRVFIEGFLVESGNVNWQEGFRYRGIASGGGASLSVLVPVAICLGLYLYSEKYIRTISLVCYLFVLMFSLVFIGRTGFILIPVVFLSFFAFNFSRYIFRSFVLFGLIAIFVYFSAEPLKQIIIDEYGIGFFNYSLGFLLSGSEGIEEEGTVGIILEFLTVMPTTFPEVLIGYGFYGGGEFTPWTDSGYSRMFLSVGYFFGALFYLSFFFLFRNVFSYKKFLFITIGIVLLIAEVKEPLLFTGYSARLYFMLLVFGLIDKKINMRQSKPVHVLSHG
jgi:hypothetical protein